MKTEMNLNPIRNLTIPNILFPKGQMVCNVMHHPFEKIENKATKKKKKGKKRKCKIKEKKSEKIFS